MGRGEHGAEEGAGGWDRETVLGSLLFKSMLSVELENCSPDRWSRVCSAIPPGLSVVNT